jgi:hypothetical protein
MDNSTEPLDRTGHMVAHSHLEALVAHSYLEALVAHSQTVGLAGRNHLEALVAHSQTVGLAGRNHLEALAGHSHLAARVVRIAPARMDHTERKDFVEAIHSLRAARRGRNHYSCRSHHMGFQVAAVEHSHQSSLGRHVGADIHNFPAHRTTPWLGQSHSHNEGNVPDFAVQWDSHTRDSASFILHRNTHPVRPLYQASIQDDA